MLKFKTSCAVLANLSSNLLNEVGLSLFRYFEVGRRVCDIVVKKFTFAISSPDEIFWSLSWPVGLWSCLTMNGHALCFWSQNCIRIWSIMKTPYVLYTKLLRYVIYLQILHSLWQVFLYMPPSCLPAIIYIWLICVLRGRIYWKQ